MPRQLFPPFHPPPPPPLPSHHIVHHRPHLPTAATGAIPRSIQRSSPPSHSATSGALRQRDDAAAAAAAAALAAAEAAVAEAARSRAAVVERMDLVSDHAVTSTSRSGNERAARIEREESIAHVAPARRGGGSGKDLNEMLPAVCMFANFTDE